MNLNKLSKCLFWTIPFLFSLGFVSIHFSSCTTKTSWNIEKMQLKRTVHLCNDTTMPSCQTEISIDYLAKNSDIALEHSLNQLILDRCLGEDYAKRPVKEAVENFASDFAKKYRNDLEMTYLEEAKTSEYPEAIKSWFSFVKIINGQISSQASDLLTYKIDTYDFTGGAHGISLGKFYNIALPELKVLQLKDIFVEDSEDILTDLIKNQLMINFNVTTMEELEEVGIGVIGDIVPTENFYFTEQGIVFYYNVYEIAPYAQGPVEVCVPHEMLASILSESFPKSLK